MRNNSFSKRQGANHVIKSQSSYVNQQSNAFQIGRIKFNEVLKQYSFIRVIEINNLPRTQTKHEFYFGKGEILSNSREERKQKFVFFDKAGRNKRETLNIGPCKLVDCAWGKEHISAKVDIGDILVGVLVQNPRQSANVDKVLTNWSKNGKIVMEFARLIEFGTKFNVHEISRLLLQNSCELALQAQSFPSSFFFNDMGGYVTKESLQAIAKCKDDFYFAIKIILWGELKDMAILHMIENPELGIQMKHPPLQQEIEICKSIRISEKSLNFITLLSSKLEDFSILTKFYEFFDEISYPQQPEPDKFIKQSIQGYGGYNEYGNKTPEYMEEKNQFNNILTTTTTTFSSNFSGNFSPPSPDYIGDMSSPSFIPSSPKYFPTSPKSPPKSPSSSTLNKNEYPSSPKSPKSPQSPQSPPYHHISPNKESPKIDLPLDKKERKPRKKKVEENLEENLELVKKVKKNKNKE